MRYFKFDILLPLAFALISTNVFAQGSGQLSYGELIDLVKNNNASVQSARLMVEASEKRTGHLLRSFLPNIKTFVGYENYTTSGLENRTDPYGGIEVSVNIFNFGRELAEENIRKAEYRQSQIASNIDFNSKLYEARQIYWKIVYHQELIKILEKARNKNNSLLKAANQRIKRGLTTETDRLEFDMYDTDLETNIESIRHENKILKIALGKYLGVDVRTKEIGFAAIPHDHDEDLIGEVFEKNSNLSVQMAEASHSLLRFKSLKAKKWWTPSVELYGGYAFYTARDRTFLDRADRDDTFAGVRLTMNLFDGNKSSSEFAAVAAISAAAEARLKYIFEEELAEFAIIQEEMKHAHELTHVSENKIKKGESYFKRTLEEYDKGVKNSLDALSALKRVVSFKAEYAKIRLDYQNKKAALKKMKGI